jgi:hypothetical protein
VHPAGSPAWAVWAPRGHVSSVNATYVRGRADRGVIGRVHLDERVDRAVNGDGRGWRQRRTASGDGAHPARAGSIQHRAGLDRQPAASGRAGVPDGPHWLAFRIRAHAGLSDTRDLPGRAQAMIAADLFARSSAAAGLPAVSGASLHLQDADGRRLYATSWHTTPNRSRLLGWSLQGRSLRAAIAHEALASGLGVGSIRVIGAPVRAVEIVVTTASPAGLRRRLDQLAATLRPLQRPARQRGLWSSLTYLEVDDHCGAPVVAEGVGGAWADPRWLCPNLSMPGKDEATCPPPARGC